MASRIYQNFELAVEHEASGSYRAHVTSAPHGKGATSTFWLSPDEHPFAFGGSAPTRYGDGAIALGSALFEAVFSDHVGLAWQLSQKYARAQGDGLRLLLRLTGVPALAGLPWELLYDRRSNSFIARSERTPVVRYVGASQPPRPLAVDGPLRILVVISSPVDRPELDVDHEWRGVHSALAQTVAKGTVKLDRLAVPTVQALSAWLRQHEVHILHVIGGGDYDERIQEGVIYLQDRYGRSVGVSPTVLGPYLRDHDPLRLVMLNASHPARMDSRNPILTTAQGLVEQGCPAVVAMQFPMSDGAAATFNGEFYGALADGFPVDQAATGARKVLLVEYAAAEWATPALLLRTPDGRLFDHVVARSDTGHIVVRSETGHIAARSEPDELTGPEPPAPSDPQAPLGGWSQPVAERPWDSREPVDIDGPWTGGVPPLPPTSHAPAPPPSEPAPQRSRSAWRGVRSAIGRWLGGGTPIRRPGPTSRQRDPGASRTAYPRIDVHTGRKVRPDVVVVEEPFDVVVGLERFADAAITPTGGIRFSAESTTQLDLVLVYDPSSLEAQTGTALRLMVTDDDPFPSARVTFVALYRPDLPSERRIGVHYLRDGQVVGIAWRTIIAVSTRDDVVTAPLPPVEPKALLDLEPLLGEDLPDLILSICASDGPATGEFVWMAYAGASRATVPDAPRVSRLDGHLQKFVTDMRQTVAFSHGPYADYLSLVGKAKKLGRAVPSGIQAALREVVEDPSRTEAATVLLLTEELALPWELTVFDDPLKTAFGGLSPFLGAHAAISRWPLTRHPPRPTPRANVTVRRAAVLSADYAGVSGWSRLEHALAEARAIAGLFAPPAVAVRPSLPDVMGVLRGTPPADVLHVALHGQFDATGSQEGLVLLDTDASGNLSTSAQFFTPDQVENGKLDGGPFVFLNACQVASDKRVLGDYAGFASTLLRIGATGVVAPLWNVDDDVAAEFAAEFYAATWTATGQDGSPEPASVAEAVRALRARYTEAAAETHTPGITATLIAFQVFGHPRLRLAHV
ncbi:MAG: CHAT domain-containing protein [Lapillicoccus sp.]